MGPAVVILGLYRRCKVGPVVVILRTDSCYVLLLSQYIGSKRILLLQCSGEDLSSNFGATFVSEFCDDFYLGVQRSGRGPSYDGSM
jgi:hypothetical protein